MKNQFEFKPFDKVLVRDVNEAVWKASFFSHINKNRESAPYHCVAGNWIQCIPYNEETAHLLGTNKPYQPKVKEVTYQVRYVSGNRVCNMVYTEEVFKEFINKEVCDNKDIKSLVVNIIIPD